VIQALQISQIVAKTGFGEVSAAELLEVMAIAHSLEGQLLDRKYLKSSVLPLLGPLWDQLWPRIADSTKAHLGSRLWVAQRIFSE